jgi:AcrR family transcriptional regulator
MLFTVSRQRLTRERVVARALELADAEGVEAITMRRLGALLGVEGMALYTHVRDKDDLLTAVGDLVLHDLEIEPRAGDDWRGRIEAVCFGWADLRARHAGAFPLVFRAPAVAPVTEELMDALRTAGFRGRKAWLAYQTLVFFLDSALLLWPTRAPGEVWRVHDDSGPHFRALAKHAQHYSWDDVYANGLRLLLDGLEQQRVA